MNQPSDSSHGQGKANVLIIAALKEEFDALMTVTGGEASWKAVKEENFTQYYVKDFESEQGFSFRVAAMWSNKMGTTAAATLATRLTSELKPQCLAMCGICAGRRDWVFLGDIIVADRVFRYDEGTIKEGNRKGEITTFNLKPKWKTAVEEMMGQWKPLFLNERSLSIDYQSQWLLRGIAALEAGKVSKLQDYAEIDQYVANRQASFKRLKQRRWVKEQGFKLTEEGKQYWENEQFMFPDKPEADPEFRVHLGPVGTGTNVIQDGKIFEKLSDTQRKIIGLEMEGEAIGIVSEIQEIEYMIFVKGVCDYADQYKDDSFRDFAAKSSASFLIDFLKKYLPQTPSEDNVAGDKKANNTRTISIGTGNYVESVEGDYMEARGNINKVDQRNASIHGYAPNAQGSTIVSGQKVTDNVIKNVQGNNRENSPDYNFEGATFGAGFAGRDYTGDVQHNTYQAPVGIAGGQGDITVSDNARVAGIINEYGSKKLNDIAQELTTLLDYFEQNNPSIPEAVQRVNTAKENAPELNDAQVIEATIIDNPTLSQRILSATKAASLETIKALLPPLGVAIEAVKAYRTP